MFFIFFLLVIIVIAFILSYYIADLSIRIVSSFTSKNISCFDIKTLQTAFAPIRASYMLTLMILGLTVIGVPNSLKFWFKPLVLILTVLIFSWLTLNVIDLIFGKWLAEYFRKNKQSTIVGMIPFGRRFLKTTVVLLATLTFLQNIGVNVTALLAGLGLGGIAVALGAQKMVGDLIGGMMLILDQPIRVGDDCKFGVHQGTVEEIGIRTTKIRTAERTLVAIPNADFSQMQLENLSSRDRIRFHCILGIRKNATIDQIQFLLIEFKKLLCLESKIEQDSIRVRLSGISTDSLDIEVNCYVLTSKNIEFSEVKENILLKFLHKIQEAGTNLAFFPSAVFREQILK